MTRRRFLGAAVAGAIAAAVAPAVWALTSRSGADGGPPTIAYGSDRCDQCGMIISEVRFASAWRDGRLVRRYDDIGCLARGSGPRLAAGRGSAFVHDSAHGDWMEVAQAAFVRSPQIRTPMHYGIAAFADRLAATTAYPSAQVTTWADLLLGVLREQS